MNFEIDPECLCSVMVKIVYPRFGGRTDLTDDEFLHLLKNPEPMVGTRHEDHPEFAKLRDRLEHLGYIKTERTWWNGDRVLKPFALNGARFRKGDRFLCAAAIRWDIEIKLEVQTKRKK